MISYVRSDFVPRHLKRWTNGICLDFQIFVNLFGNKIQYVSGKTLTKGERKAMSVQPFTVNIAKKTLDDLQQRLANTRWTNEIEGADWNYGTNLAYLKKLAKYWQDKFDWRQQEEFINNFAHFRAEVDGLKIHFIHERSREANSLPIILTHGFPDSFFRFSKIIPMLTNPEAHGGTAEDTFDVIVPSLPGYGFSERPKTAGVTAHVADLWAKLVTDKLGYERFAAAGGDMGSGVTQQLAIKYSDSIVGIHLTDVPWQNFTAFQMSGDPSKLSEPEKKYFQAAQAWMMQEGAYAMIQSTKPQTLAFGLNDSPVALAAWIVEKFRAWSDCEGDVESCFTKDELLTNITIYWATETINSAFLYYYEPSHQKPTPFASEIVKTPTGFARFPKDLTPAPREWAERFFGNITRWTEMPRGGHFAAMEKPELLVEDIRAFFRPLRKPSNG